MHPQVHIGALEGSEENRAALLLGLEYLLNISFVDDDEVRDCMLPQGPSRQAGDCCCVAPNPWHEAALLWARPSPLLMHETPAS